MGHDVARCTVVRDETEAPVSFKADRQAGPLGSAYRCKPLVGQPS